MASLGSASQQPDFVLTRDEFERAVTSCGYPAPTADVYDALATEFAGYARPELAMLLAQLIHQSLGFQRREQPVEEYVAEPAGAEAEPGKSYHGRGYILLVHASNYRAASRDLGLGERLLREPELAAGDTSLAMQVSRWYWERVVRLETEQERDCFGATTRSINGGIECSGGFHPVAHERWLKYLKVADALGLKERARECGCYN